MKIVIETIQHADQRYPTCGDWYFENGVLQIKVSETATRCQYGYLITIHELVEAILCAERGITEKLVSDFDIEFEKIREQHPKIIGEQEPGNMVNAPYHEEHIFASYLEDHLRQELKINLEDYEDVINNL